MLETVLTMLLTFGGMYHGRDKVWTPTFEGNGEKRFVQAMEHYRVKMGLEDSLIYAYGGKHPKNWCASVERSRFFEAVVVTWYEQDSGCRRSKPEFWALHEACHLRHRHHYGRGTSIEGQERETRECMVLYSAKERR